MSQSVLEKLDPKLRKRLSLAGDLESPACAETPSMALNRALGGGFRYGRQHLVFGGKSSGKSSMLLQMIGIEQAKGKTAAWIDSEESFDRDWAAKLGVNVNELIVSTARSINDMVDVGTSLMRAGVDIVVVDSISSLLPAVFFEKGSDDLKALENTKQIGADARDMAHAVKMLNYANNQGHSTCLILISQTRNDMSGMHVSLTHTGGQSVAFYSSTIVQLFSSKSEQQAIQGKVSVGDRVIERTIGRKVTWNVKFSKTSSPFQSGTYDFYFDGRHGVDTLADMVDLAESLGLVERSGSWYSVGDVRVQGRPALVEAVRNNPELQQTLQEGIDGL